MILDGAYNAGMVIAKTVDTDRNRYMHRGVNQEMFTKYIKSVSKQDRPVILSITETTVTVEREPVIQRNAERVPGESNRSDIYLRAREIYFRARRHRPVRAASIF